MKHFLALCFFVIIAVPALAEPATLRLAYADIEVFPNQLGGSTEIPADPGIAVEILQHGFAEAGIELQLTRLPNRRVLDSVKTGDVDGAFLFSFNTERNRFAAYPQKDGVIDAGRRLARQTYVIYKRAGDTLGFDGHSFSNLQTAIAANSGFSVTDDLKRLGVPVVEVETTSLAFGMLQAGRVDGYAVMDDTGDPYLRGAGITSIVKLPEPISAKDYYLIFGRAFQAADPALVERIWDQLTATRAGDSAGTRPEIPRDRRRRNG